MRYIEDLRDGEQVVEHYLCKRRQSAKTRAGKNYLSLTLSDKTGTIEAKVWELNNQIQSFEENDFIKVDGEIQVYNDEPQMKVSRIRKSGEGEYNPMDYIPATGKDIDGLWNELLEGIRSVTNPHLKQLLEMILIRNETVSRALKTHSAARNMHHSYLGGLLEHTLSVVQICGFLCGRYQAVNKDILITGALLHDIGKVFELSPFPENDYTDDGQLIGHIVLINDLITETIAQIPGFPDRLRSLIKHCVLAHHGEYAFGSPKLPATIEAFILHCADNIDAKIKMYEDMIAHDNTHGAWVGYHRVLQRNIRKSDF